LTLADDCTLNLYDAKALSYCDALDCDHDDLNDFFLNDSVNYMDQLLGKTYCFTLNTNPKSVIAAFTIANDSIKTTHLPQARKQSVQKLIPHSKVMRSYPAVLIGRLGVSKQIGRSGIGTEVIEFIKAWFISPGNKTGCRYIVVDAYNEERPLKFYEKNHFKFLFSTENQERDFLRVPPDWSLKTRLMYFDLIVLKS
jgi:GNAT superfamily N-acetyltransferase